MVSTVICVFVTFTNVKSYVHYLLFAFIRLYNHFLSSFSVNPSAKYVFARSNDSIIRYDGLVDAKRDIARLAF